jgi:MoxR-like ATPase
MTQKFHDLETDLSRRFLEREEVIHGLTLAALTGEHVFLLGPPGTAKSLLARDFAGMISARNFEWLITRFTTPEELFGVVSLKAMKEHDSFRRNTASKLPEAEIAFLDELWKGNSAILNALLTIINERIYHNDGTPMHVPLLTVVVASNEIPEGDTTGNLAALYDRFLLRYQVGYLSDAGLLELLTRSTLPPITPLLSITDLQTAEVDLAQVTIPKSVVEAVISIRSLLKSEGIVISDRRFFAIRKLLQANAWLDGRGKVEDGDLETLCHCLWNTPSQINTVKKIVLKAANPQWIKALELYEAAEAVATTALAVTDDAKKMESGVEAGHKLKKAVEQLTKLADGKPGRIADLTTKTVGLYKTVIKECMGMDVALPGGCNGGR